MNNEWVDVEGYEGIYQVNRQGDVKSLARVRHCGRGRYYRYGEAILAKNQGYRGYMTVSLSKDAKTKTVPLHRVIAKAFIPNPEKKPQVNHIDSNKTNNRIENLEWVTEKENSQHCVSQMRHPSVKKRKLSDVEILTVYTLSKKYSCKEIGAHFNVSQSLIRFALNGRTYSNVFAMINTNRC